MRMLLLELRPPMNGRLSLVEALDDRLEAVEQRAGVEATLEVETGLLIDRNLQNEFYRIATEALNNSLKYSAASVVHVRLLITEDSIEMIIEDNGKGFDPESNRAGGMGIRTIRERARIPHPYGWP
jgi:two-component system, NarL family, sensor histidine kinase LiaS